VHAPFDPPHSKQTLPFGVNDQGWVVGRFFRNQREHGFLFRLGTDRFLVFDYPGAAFTSLNGINNDGLSCGRNKMRPVCSMGSWLKLSPASKRASRAHCWQRRPAAPAL
jgi:hypothetical protein